MPENKIDWIDAEIERTKFFLSANFIVLATSMILVRTTDPDLTRALLSSLAVISSGYALICGAVFQYEFYSLKELLLRMEAFGPAEPKPDDSNGDALTKNLEALAELDEATQLRTLRFIETFIGLRVRSLSVPDFHYHEFHRAVDGVDTRSQLATLIALIFFGLSVLSFLFSAAFD